MEIEKKIQSLGLKLPQPPQALANYIPARKAGDFIFVSGQLPLESGKLLKTGKLGKEISLEEGQELAKKAVLNSLACILTQIQSLDSILSIVRLGVYVASTPDFTNHHLVANGASDTIVQIFGDKGKHARFAIGVPSLPLDSPVEIELIVQISK